MHASAFNCKYASYCHLVLLVYHGSSILGSDLSQCSNRFFDVVTQLHRNQSLLFAGPSIDKLAKNDSTN